MKNSKGFTLIEIMIVLVIVVTLSFLGTSLITNTFRSKARELTWRMTSTVKYLFNSAITENKTIRLVFDFESNSYWAEGTSDKFLLESPEEREEREKLKKDSVSDTEKKKEETGPEKTEEGEVMDRPLAGSEATDGTEEKPAPALEPMEPSFGSIETPLMGTKQLPSGIYLKDVQTPHDKEPISEGRAYIYFFQNGSSEEAVVNLRDEADEKHISIKIDPFTGRTDIEQEYRKLEEAGK